MQVLVHKNYTPSKTNVEQETVLFTDQEKEILAYIAGFVVRKQASHPALMSDRAETSGFLAAKDRGGLTHPSKALVDIIMEVEKAF